MFQNLNQLYTLNLEANILTQVDDFAWANLGALRDLNIANNKLNLLAPNTFQNTFLPTSDSRVLYSCGRLSIQEKAK